MLFYHFGTQKIGRNDEIFNNMYNKIPTPSIQLTIILKLCSLTWSYKLLSFKAVYLCTPFSFTYSTVSSGINAITLVFMEDIIKPLYFKGRRIEDKKAKLLSKVIGRSQTVDWEHGHYLHRQRLSDWFSVPAK